VIAIIAILAAILFPVFAKVREKARQTTCASNEKQILLATLEYCNDYDDYLPGTIFPKNGSDQTNGYTWMTAVLPYIKNGKSSVGYTERGVIQEGGVFSCPSVTLDGFPIYSPANDVMPNYWAGLPDGSDKNHHAVVLNDVVAPSEKILYYEVGANGAFTTSGIGVLSVLWVHGGADWGNIPTNNHYIVDPTTGDRQPGGYFQNCDTKIGTTDTWLGCDYTPRYRHNGMANMGFSDGHVKAQRPTDFDWDKQVYNAPTFNAYGCGGCSNGF
jgi:prepilin-type processing-associated H-X9-DG protein